MHLKLLLSILTAGTVGANVALAQEPTGTLKKIKDTGTITLAHRESSVPFSYYDDKQQVVGYAMDLCHRIVDAVKAELKLPNLQVNLNPVTSATRIPLIANGTVDLECGSTTNNLEREKQVSFTITHFVTANRFVSKKSANLRTVEDLRRKTVVSTSGTTNIKQITEINAQKGLNLNILAAALSVEPYGIMLRRGDPAFKKVVDQAMIDTYRSGAINAIYETWFLKPVPPKGINLNVPMSASFKKVIASPTDSGDPAVY